MQANASMTSTGPSLGNGCVVHVIGFGLYARCESRWAFSILGWGVARGVAGDGGRARVAADSVLDSAVLCCAYGIVPNLP